MLDTIDKLIKLQDHDRQTLLLEAELETVAPQRALIEGKTQRAAAAHEAARLKVKTLESERKELELEVEAKRELIERYSMQQYQTRRNEEYRALTHEIDNCKAEITRVEDHELEVMVQIDEVQAEVVRSAKALTAIRHEADTQLKSLSERELDLKQRLADLQGQRESVAAAVEADLLLRYERLRKSKGERVIVGVERGFCSGCHVKVPTQVIVLCQGGQEVLSCPNCGRILYYDPAANIEE